MAVSWFCLWTSMAQSRTLSRTALEGDKVVAGSDLGGSWLSTFRSCASVGGWDAVQRA